MKNFYWKTKGTGNINLILLSGWGLNSKIWFFIIKKLNPCFKFYLIDLPGFGYNKHLNPMKIDEIIKILHSVIPKNSIFLGWSIGGLIASYFALSYPQDILGIISVSSSPCFIEKRKWPGIKKNTLKKFFCNLKENYPKTINNFLNCQIIGDQTDFQDIVILKKIFFFESQPSSIALYNSFKMLCSIDLRLEIIFLKVPLLRIYGSLDTLVPKKIVQILDQKWPHTKSTIIEKAAHAPFLSHKKEFCSILMRFKKNF